MALTYYPITGNGYMPDGVTSEAGQWRIRLAQGYALDGSNWRADEQRFDVAADGSCPALAAPGLPATTGTQVYSATFVSASGRVVMGPYTFTLTAAKTFADILSEPGVVVPTTDLVAEAQASATAAKTSETNAKTSETNAAASATSASSSATAAGNSATSASGSASAASTSETNAASSATSAANAAAQASTTLANTYPRSSMPVLATNLATQPIPTGTDITGAGAGYNASYWSGDSTATLVAAGGDGPIVDGAALAYRRKAITSAGVTGDRTVWQFTQQNTGVSTAPSGSCLQVTAGRQYRVTWWQRITIAGTPVAAQAGITYSIFDASGNTIGAAATIFGPTIAYGSWQRVTLVLPTVPAGGVQMAIRQRSIAPTVTTGDTSDVTGLMITDVTDNPALDASYHDGGSLGCQWTGAVNNSTSQRLLVRPADDFDRKLGNRSTGQVPVVDLTQTSGWRFSTHLELEDVGSPEGIKTAPVGAIYRDMAGTNGAWVWRKASGTGNVGWTVIDGEVSWQTLSPIAANGWTGGGVSISRTGPWVRAQFSGTRTTAGSDWISLASWTTIGFTPADPVPIVPTFSNAANTIGCAATAFAGSQSIVLLSPPMATSYGWIEWSTTDPWPATPLA